MAEEERVVPGWQVWQVVGVAQVRQLVMPQLGLQSSPSLLREKVSAQKRQSWSFLQTAQLMTLQTRLHCVALSNL